MYIDYFFDVGIALFAEDNVAIRFLPIAACGHLILAITFWLTAVPCE
jgi:hypothetical protein